MQDYDSDDSLLFIDDDTTDSVVSSSSPWRILVVDDDPEVHDLTQLVLRDLTFDERSVILLNAHSAQEARESLEQHDDIALILLDVVMESDNAGLDLVRFIRRELDNQQVRIILRTGQPGQAPERDVILDYDINDYKEKTELTSRKLVTAVIAGLRSFNYIQQIVTLNQDLEQKVAERTELLQQTNDQLAQSLRELQEGQEAARQIQFKLLPHSPAVINHVHFSHRLIASDTMSGDFVDYFELDENRTAFYMADVSGHGVPSAFVTVYLKRYVSEVMHQYRERQDQRILSPTATLEGLNDALLGEDMGKHVAIFYGVIDRHEQQLTYCNAGIFPFPLLTTHNRVQVLDEKSPPAGLFDFADYRQATVSLSDDFQLLVCSDGVLEMMSESSAEEQKAALQEAVKQPLTNPEEVIGQLALTLDEALPDDLTILLVKASSQQKGTS